MKSRTRFQRILFWQSIVSPHQASFLRALSAHSGLEVKLVVQEELSQTRRGLGWRPPDTSGVDVIVAPTEARIRRLIGESPNTSLHMVSGLDGLEFHRALVTAQRVSHIHLGVIAEGGDPSGIRGSLRRIAYIMKCGLHRSRHELLLAMGENGVAWYRKCGWPEAHLFPFAYSTEIPGPTGKWTAELTEPHTFEMIFVGQLIHRKGLDVLIAALGAIPLALQWELVIVGDGPLRDRIDRKARKAGLCERVHFKGACRGEVVRKFIRRADLLVLPSRFDGWGAVVNEALLEGTPGVCSAMCGAKDLLGATWRGDVVQSIRLEQWREVLKARIEQGPVGPGTRAQIRTWAEQAISGRCLAEYFTQILECRYDGSDRPVPPWKAKPALSSTPSA